MKEEQDEDDEEKECMGETRQDLSQESPRLRPDSASETETQKQREERAFCGER